MTKKREPKKPKIVWVGSTPITPIAAKERRKIRKDIQKFQEQLRQRYPEVRGKVVDFISHSIEDGTLYFSVRFKDKTNFSLRFACDVHRRSRLHRHADGRLGDDSRVHEADSKVRTFTSQSRGRCCGPDRAVVRGFPDSGEPPRSSVPLAPAPGSPWPYAATCRGSDCARVRFCRW